MISYYYKNPDTSKVAMLRTYRPLLHRPKAQLNSLSCHLTINILWADSSFAEDPGTIGTGQVSP